MTDISRNVTPQKPKVSAQQATMAGASGFREQLQKQFENETAQHVEQGAAQQGFEHSHKHEIKKAASAPHMPALKDDTEDIILARIQASLIQMARIEIAEATAG